MPTAESSSSTTTTVLAEIVLLRRVCNDGDVRVADFTMVGDLIVLDMTSFDVILGMDWLAKYRASIDCFRRRVTVSTGEASVTCSLGGRNGAVLAAVFSAGEVLADGRPELPRVVCEFPGVFPDEISGLPPVREVEFGIDLAPGTAPVSVALTACTSRIG